MARIVEVPAIPLIVNAFATLAVLAAGGMCGCAKDSVTPPLTPTDAALETAGMADTAPADAGPGDILVPPTPDATTATCDRSGRWLVAQRVLATALGQGQAAHNWFYYEVAQTGAALTVTKGLHCGFEVVGKGAFAASVDSMPAWPAFLTKNTSTGRTGTASTAAGGCAVTFAREYVVRGATVAAYANPAVPLPTAAQKAEGATPGWEDWDQDGNPGLSYKVTSLVSGTLYVCQRDYTEYAGTIAAGADKWMLAVKYGSEQSVLGRSPGSSELLETPSAPSSDPAQHRVWFQRLAAGQAVGDDAAICAEVRSLARTLVPEAHD
jgi:hypothetical protein